KVGIRLIGLFIILFFVLVMPFTIKWVEKNLEIFLFIMGVLAVLVSGMYSENLLIHALLEPINITAAVIIAGLLFKWFQKSIESSIHNISEKIPFPILMFLIVTIIGIISSIITAIIAALVLVLI